MSGGYYNFPHAATSQYSTSFSTPASSTGAYAATALPGNTAAYAAYGGTVGQIASAAAGFGYPSVTSSVASNFTYSTSQAASANAAAAGFHPAPSPAGATAVGLGSDLTSVKTVPAVNVIKAAGLTAAGSYSGYDAALYAAATSFVQSKAAQAAAQAQQVAAAASSVAPAPQRSNPNVSSFMGGGGASHGHAGGNTGGSRGRGRGRYYGSRGALTGPPRQPVELMYCSVCKISCAGPTTYQEHLDGQRHKKREAQAKAEATAPVSATKTSFRCNLCDIVCTGYDTYKAHVKGSKHQKAVKLHTVLGKPIPQDEPTVIPAGGGAPVKPDSEDNSAVYRTILAEEVAQETAQPVGEDYIETMQEEGKSITYHCKLCDCNFNDLTAKDMHLKGRRHKLQYKTKVNPELIVDVKPGYRGRGGGRRGHWRDRRAQGMAAEMSHMRAMYQASMNLWSGPAGFLGPSPMPMFMGPPPALMQEDVHRSDQDDRYVLAKHDAIYPTEEELTVVQKLVNNTEAALKNISDYFAELRKSGAQGTTPLVGAAKAEKEDPATPDKENTAAANAQPAGPEYRVLKGVMRVGALAKGLLLRERLNIQLVILCSEKPTMALLYKIYELLPKNYEQVDPSKEQKYDLQVSPEHGYIRVQPHTGEKGQGDGKPKVVLTLHLTSTLMRDEPAGQDGAGEGILRQ